MHVHVDAILLCWLAILFHRLNGDLRISGSMVLNKRRQVPHVKIELPRILPHIEWNVSPFAYSEN